MRIELIEDGSTVLIACCFMAPLIKWQGQDAFDFNRWYSVCQGERICNAAYLFPRVRVTARGTATLPSETFPIHVATGCNYVLWCDSTLIRATPESIMKRHTNVLFTYSQFTPPRQDATRRSSCVLSGRCKLAITQ